MAKPSWYGINAPFKITGGGIMRQIDEVLVRADLLQLLLTAPGERVKRPSYGSPIPIFTFEDLTEDSIETLRYAILSAIDAFEPRVNVTKLDIISKPDENVVIIKIYASLKIDRGKTFELNIEVPKGQV